MTRDIKKFFPSMFALPIRISKFFWGLTLSQIGKFQSRPDTDKRRDQAEDPKKEFYLFLNKSVCNAHCIFCSRGSEQWQQKVQKEIQGFDYQAELAAIEKRLEHAQPKGVFHLGGHEPSIYPTLLPIVSAAARSGFREIILETNGLALSDKALVKQLKDRGITEVRLPIYGVSKKVHDSITGVEGSYQMLQEAISNLKSYKIRIMLKTVLLRQNLQEMHELLSRDRKMGCAFVMPSSQDPEDYRRVCPKLSSIESRILDRLGDIYLPCIMPKRMFLRGIPAQRGQGFVSLEDGRVVRQGTAENLSEEQSLQQRVFMDRCRSCSMNEKCTGIYAMYWELYGNKELFPR